MVQFYAYVYRDPSRNNEPIYVGKGQGERAWYHLSRTDKHHFVHRLAKMKRDGISPDIEIINALDEDHAYFLEECLISIFGRKDLGAGTLLNLTNGGEGAKNMSPLTKEKMSQIHKSKPRSPNLNRKGVKLSEETKQKMRDAAKRRIESGQLPYSHTGRKRSEETKQRMRESQQRRRLAVKQDKNNNNEIVFATSSSSKG